MRSDKRLPRVFRKASDVLAKFTFIAFICFPTSGVLGSRRREAVLTSINERDIVASLKDSYLRTDV